MYERVKYKTTLDELKVLTTQMHQQHTDSEVAGKYMYVHTLHQSIYKLG